MTTKGNPKSKARPDPTRWPGAEMWPLNRIKPYPHNPRTHPPREIDLLGRLMDRYGVDQPIVVDELGVILKGHGRRLSAIQRGYPSFPVVRRLGLSEDEKRAYRIADNAVPLLAGWDQHLVAADVKALKLAEFDVELLGFGDAQLVQFETTPQPPAEFRTYDEDVPVDHVCPRCGYAWSGKPAPRADAEIEAVRKEKSEAPALRYLLKR